MLKNALNNEEEMRSREHLVIALGEIKKKTCLLPSGFWLAV